jgi:hypothetical protein
MLLRNTDGLIRLGILVLPLAGLLALLGLYSTFELGPGSILVSGDNQAIVGSGYFASQLVGNGLGPSCNCRQAVLGDRGRRRRCDRFSRKVHP